MSAGLMGVMWGGKKRKKKKLEGHHTPAAPRRHRHIKDEAKLFFFPSLSLSFFFLDGERREDGGDEAWH